MGLDGEVPAWLRLTSEAPIWLRAPIRQVLDGWDARAAWSDRWRGTVTPDPVWLDRALSECLTAQSNSPGAMLLVGTDSEWVAAFGGNPRGPAILQLADWTPSEKVSFEFNALAAEGVAGFWWDAAPATPDEAAGRVRTRQRSARVWQERGRWHFQEYGEPFGFEDVARYRRSRRRERMDADMVRGYAAAFGVPLDRLDAYSGTAVLVPAMIWPETPVPHTTREELQMYAERDALAVQRLDA
jgi:hypothetical protein